MPISQFGTPRAKAQIEEMSKNKGKNYVRDLGLSVKDRAEEAPPPHPPAR